jgi:CPA2 family monovalent cation:H+ antiporter-2
MELSILKDIVIIFALSTLVNFVFTRMKVPTVLGYLLTGIIAGPHFLSLVGGPHEIDLMAEIGVVLLLFTIGLEFSLQHLLKIRRIVFVGGLVQVILTAAAFFVTVHFFKMTWQGGLYIGFLAALSSSALVLKILQERSELTSNYGRTVLGILIFQDLLLIPLLLMANLLTDSSLNLNKELIILTLKVIFIVALVYAGNRWLLPRLLEAIAMTKNQELFMMSIFLICFAVALLTSSLGMSLAFGAFLAGLMISESEYSHNVFGNFMPIKDVFTSFFFVSIGMLLDIPFVINNILLVFLSILMLLVIKSLFGAVTGFILGHTLQGTIMIGLALSQVGEFSFILAKIGFDDKILSDFYYHLFIAVAVITMALTPFLFYLGPPLNRLLMKLNLPDFIVNGLFPLEEMVLPEISGHLVIIGKDPSALKLSHMAKMYNIPHISIIFDPALARDKMNKGDVVLYGDAINEPILRKAHADTAEIVVISVGSIIPSMAITEKVRQINKTAYILVRAAAIQNVKQLYKAGADQVLPEKLEIAIDLFSVVLMKRSMPQAEVDSFIDNLRTNGSEIFSGQDELLS